ncbi:hypothetical protein [Paenibacillus sp. 1P07SE]|uniref:hypothetical protein n=1 Tax=Paenibacillus sp. 1P07SE TaxID=3132209 RepID=UPI0039A468B6
MKKLTTALVIFTLIFTCFSLSAFAENENYSEEILDAKLKKMGFPDELLNDLPLGAKRDVIDNEGLKFAGNEKTEFYVDENGKLVEKIQNTGEMSIMGTIPDTDMTMNVFRVDLSSEGGKKRYRIYNSWNWLTWTWFGLTDKAGLSYNNNFETDVTTNGEYACATYHRQTPSGPESYVGNCGGRTGDITYGGASWNYDKQASGFDSGYVAMNIKAKVTSGTAIILGKVVHDTSLNGTIGVQIGWAQLGYSSSGSFDEASGQDSWNF